MKREKTVKVRGEIVFEVGNMFTKKATRSGNAGHVAVPKSLIGKTIIVIVPAKKTDLKLIQANHPSKLSYAINPDMLCEKCKLPLLRPAWDKKEELMLCQCIRT